MRKLISNTVGTTGINALGVEGSGLVEKHQPSETIDTEEGKVLGTNTEKPITL